ncbi:hypothetical protein R1sor_019645 [Riccia sorocarpa]|uniref:Uncharacterized protein n=1 Tax=Riccia sorocarpa TaxID=122646 RepID=A0ABD3ID35_9MARC
MTRPPRPKYPSDHINYHEQRRPGLAHTIRLPEELLPTYNALKVSLGARASHADVIRFLFEAAEPAIHVQLHAAEIRVVSDSQNDLPMSDPCEHDFNEEAGEIAADSDDSDEDTAVEAGVSATPRNRHDSDVVMDSQVPRSVGAAARIYADAANGIWSKTKIKEIFLQFHVCCPADEAGGSQELQRTRPLKYPELAAHDIAYKLKSWIYTCAKNAALRGDTTPELLTKDIHNAADHWAGDHSGCRALPGVRKCVVENWSGPEQRKYNEGGETHLAVKGFLKKYITENKMRFYISRSMRKENYNDNTREEITLRTPSPTHEKAMSLR